MPGAATRGIDWEFGGPGRDRTDDLFHAMEARSQLRHRPTLERPGGLGSREVQTHFRPHWRDSQRAGVDLKEKPSSSRSIGQPRAAAPT